MTSAGALAWLDAQPGVRAQEPLAPRTTYRIGGCAERYTEVGDGDDLATLLVECGRREVEVTALGAGSNILVSDQGVAGLVVRPAATSVDVDGEVLRAGAGARMVAVARAAAAAGLTGMEWGLGIPGTVGGSIHNNAGCFGSDMASTLTQVRGVGADGESKTWNAADCGFIYRGSAFRNGSLTGTVLTGGDFQLAEGDPAVIEARMAEVQAQRHATQPVSGRSTGSVFKNPPGDHAGRLIEVAGLKGQSVGGAMVSREHANFIVNTGGATAADVVALVHLVHDRVAQTTGIRLQTEIQAIGRWPEGPLFDSPGAEGPS